MRQPDGHHLAEFNIGVLRYDWDDPRLADFADNVDRVNRIAQRSPGFVWQMSPEDMEAAQKDPNGPLGGNPRTASTLSVWRDAASLEHFVWNTIHKAFFERRAEWYASEEQGGFGVRLVLWWVAEGHQPSIAEAADRMHRLARVGDTERAFGWGGLNQA
jgi:hypothetical protein